MMNAFITLIKLDFLQRTRNYAFLITLCATLAIAYSFVPEPNANYSTIRIADYVGYYNSAWFGYVTAIMTSIFLSLIGFYLVNGSIKKDSDTNVGQIIATTSIKNFKYLFSKALSNFLMLMIIMVLVFLMSIALFFLYNEGYPFELFQFVKPYVFITIPALFIISVLALVFEVFFREYSVLQNIGFFFLFATLMIFSPKTQRQFSLDIFGSKIVLHQLEESVKKITNTDKNSNLSIGYVLGNTAKPNKFLFNGIDFSGAFLWSRLWWVILCVLLLFLVSALFHRFDNKQSFQKKEKKTISIDQSVIKDIHLSKLSSVMANYSLIPLVKTEVVLLIRAGKQWLWTINLIGIVLLAFLPIKTAHQIVLPMLWFLQVCRLSNLIIRERTHNVYYFSSTAFKPITRVMLAQMLSGIITLLFLAFPLLLRWSLLLNGIAVASIILGSVFIVLLATFLGVLSKGNKLFEVVFFLITYANLNGIVFADYFGGFAHNNLYTLKIVLFILLFASVIFLHRKYELHK